MSILAGTGMILSASLLERKDAKAALNEALRIRDDFLSIASHELKTPLTALSLQIHMGKRNFSSEDEPGVKLGAVFDRFTRQVDRLKILTEDLLTRQESAPENST